MSVATKRGENPIQQNVTHRRSSRDTGQHSIHAMTTRVRKRCVPTRGRTHTPPTGGIQAVSGEREATQQPPPNKRHSHAHHDLSRREQPNPVHPHPRKTHERHPKPYKPLYLSSSIYQPRATGRGAGTTNARTPRHGAHATLTKLTIARRHSRAQPRGRRQHGETRHIKGQGPRPRQTDGHGPRYSTYTWQAKRLHNSIPAATRATRHAPPPIRYTRLTRRQAQPHHQTRR